jgi:acyl homoserine lactone synthase
MNRSWSPFQAPSHNEIAQRTETNAAAAVDADSAVAGKRIRTRFKKLDSLGQVNSVSLSFRNAHEHGALLPKYLEARKQIFLDGLGWKIAESDGMEFDQYDTPHARWIILHQFGEVLGGVRMLPTTATCGIYSYMLRDAQRGILEDLPSDILFFTAPVEHNVWEASRFFVSRSVPAAHRLQIQKLLFRSMSRSAKENGAVHVLGIVPSVWARWARRLGVEATPIGAKFTIDEFASQSVLFKVGDMEL